MTAPASAMRLVVLFVIVEPPTANVDLGLSARRPTKLPATTELVSWRLVTDPTRSERLQKPFPLLLAATLLLMVALTMPLLSLEPLIANPRAPLLTRLT